MPILLEASLRKTNKQRRSSDDGNSSSSGIVLNMDMVSTSYYAVAYTVPVQVGSSQQNLSLQVDTGSSDLWIASKSCSSSSCSATNGRLYDPSSSQQTGATLTMQYLAGSINGPIVWDRVQIGGYTIPGQALAAATTVNNEPLSYDFDGILGLALPSNSLIQQIIPASTGNEPDGATLSSNLLSLSLTPAPDAPPQAFFSLTLARPGFSQIPSLLGIGSHPPEIVSDPTHIRYSSLVSNGGGMLFWKTTVRAITVYANGHTYPVTLQSLSGNSAPTALLDSGTPLIITTPALANGIYGALGISPASDGNYYVPCATPLNMTITLDGQDELPLHPLDLTTEPEGQDSAQFCTGLIQTDPSQLTATSDIGDIILGVPFMRNVYTVMAYERPNAAGNINNTVLSGTNATLGLLSLTNATQAMVEFDQVRVTKVPLGSGGSSPQATSAGQGSDLVRSVGIQILIGLVGLFVLCLALFGVRWFFVRRRLRRSSPKGDQKEAYDTYQSSVDQRTLLSLHTKDGSRYTVDSSRTRVGEEDDDDDGTEFGKRIRKSKLGSGISFPTDLDVCDDPWDPYAGTWRDTIVGTEAGKSVFSPVDSDSPSELSAMLHQQHDSERSDSGADDDPGELSVGMAGIGTAARGSLIDATFLDGHRRPSWDSVNSTLRSSDTTQRTFD